MRQFAPAILLFAALLGAPFDAPAQVTELTEGDGTVHITNVPSDPRYQSLGVVPPPAVPAAAGVPPAPAAPAIPVAPAAPPARPGLAARPPAFDAHIRDAAQRYGVPEELVTALIQVESGFNPRAVSPKGARGLMQLMPATAGLLGIRDVFDPAENIDGGVRHLRALLERFEHDLPLVLAAYNAGEGAVTQYGGIPPYPETQQYVARILRLLGEEAPAGLETAEPGAAGPGAGWTPIYVFVAEDGATVYTNIPRRPR